MCISSDNFQVLSLTTQDESRSFPPTMMLQVAERALFLWQARHVMDFCRSCPHQHHSSLLIRSGSLQDRATDLDFINGK